MQQLIIDLNTLPECGASFSGMLEADIFAFPEHDEATPVTGLNYDLDVQRFDSELLLRGHLWASFSFTCVVTLQRFVQTIHLDDCAIAVEIGDTSLVDVTEAMREELVIELPMSPRCDQADEPMACQMDSPYLVVDKANESDIKSPPAPAADFRWSALDALQDLKDNH